MRVSSTLTIQLRTLAGWRFRSVFNQTRQLKTLCCWAVRSVRYQPSVRTTPHTRKWSVHESVHFHTFSKTNWTSKWSEDFFRGMEFWKWSWIGTGDSYCSLLPSSGLQNCEAGEKCPFRLVANSSIFYFWHYTAVPLITEPFNLSWWKYGKWNEWIWTDSWTVHFFGCTHHQHHSNAELKNKQFEIHLIWVKWINEVMERAKSHRRCSLHCNENFDNYYLVCSTPKINKMKNKTKQKKKNHFHLKLCTFLLKEQHCVLLF